MLHVLDWFLDPRQKRDGGFKNETGMCIVVLLCILDGDLCDIWKSS